MHPNSERGASVRRLQRPPIRQSVLVQSDINHTFGAFVRTIAHWWPVALFSSGKEAVRDILVEERLGGRISEIWEDGTVVVWGEILRWDPPLRFLMTWSGTPATTEVEFTFLALGPALTRVTVEHRGWDSIPMEHVARHGFANVLFLRRHGEWWQLLLQRMNQAAQ